MSNRLFGWVATIIMCGGALSVDIDTFMSATKIDWLTIISLVALNLSALICLIIVICREVLLQAINDVETEYKKFKKQQEVQERQP